jgi:hypothetical protein
MFIDDNPKDFPAGKAAITATVRASYFFLFFTSFFL